MRLINMRFVLSLVVLICAAVVGALGCSTALSAPTAVVGPDQSNVAVGSVVSLDGTKSSDPQGLGLYYSWKFVQLPAGSKAVLSGADTAQPSFLVDEMGTYQVQLVVSNGVQTSAPATTTVTAGTCGTNLPQASMITASPSMPAVGQHVGLTATVTDDDVDKCKIPGLTLSYGWTLAKAPLGSQAKIDLAATPNPFFTPDMNGTYTVVLVVTDSRGRQSMPASLDITVGNCGNNPPAVGAVSAMPSSPNTSQLVQLSATVSDADQTAPCNVPESFSYAWSFASIPAGSMAKLNLPTATNPSFAPDVPGSYVVQLVVTDSHGQSSVPGTVTVTAGTCGNNPPSVTMLAASPSAPNIGQAVQMSATVSDADTAKPCNLTETFAYAWSIVSAPSGSHASLNLPSATDPSFTPDVAGNYTIQLVVTDSQGQVSPPSTVVVTAAGCGNNPPVVGMMSASPSSSNTGQTVQMSATVTDVDNGTSCGLNETFSYAWSIAAAPAGSHASLNLPGATNPSFTPDLPGSYTIQLIATDSAGQASTPATTVVTAVACGTNPPVVAMMSANPSAPDTGQPAQLTANITDLDNGASCGLKETFSYAWSITAAPSGSHASLNLPNASNPSFTPDVPGSYTVELVATDSGGQTSTPATLVVTAAACGTNPPVVSVITPTPTGSIDVGQVVMLTPTVTDADTVSPCNLSETFSYAWQLTSLPTGSHASLNNWRAVAPSFAPDVAGNYTASLVVTDSGGQSSAVASVTITASTCGSGAPVATLSAGPSSPDTYQTVQLSATVADPDNGAQCNLNETFKYWWTSVSAPSGSNAYLSDPALQNPSFVPNVPGAYTFSLVVTDSAGTKSAPTSLTVNVGTCGSSAPVAQVQELTPNSAGPGSNVTGPTVAPGATVQVSGAASFDPDDQAPCSLNETLTYRWRFLQLPAGSFASLNDPSIVNPSFQADVFGTYVLSLVVTDSNGQMSSQATFTLSADPAVGIVVPAGFTASTVAFGSPINGPQGLTEDGSGNIYVAQQGNDDLIKIVGNAATVLTSGGLIQGGSWEPSYSAAASRIFLSTGNNTIITVTPAGVQTSCIGSVGGASWLGIELYQGGTLGARLLAADNANNDVAFIDPNPTSPTFCLVLTTNDFSGGTGGNLRSVWGVTGRVIGGVDQIFVDDDNRQSVWQNGAGSYVTNAGTNTLISQFGAIQLPRKLVTTPCTTPKILMANLTGGGGGGRGDIMLLTDSAGSTQSIPFSNLQRPVGLYVESATSFLVTDEATNAVYRISGNICSL